MNMSAGEIARLVGGSVQGNPDAVITGVNGILEAEPGDLCFARSPKYLPMLEKTRASAALVPAPVDAPSLTLILVEQPEAAFLRILTLFAREKAEIPAPGIHENAQVDPSVVCGEGTTISAHVVVEKGVVLGSRVRLYPGVYVGANCVVGDDTVVHPNAVIREETRIGRGCIIHSGVCIGSDGFGFFPMNGEWMKIPQVGTVEIGDNVEIGSNTCIDRATFGVTRIGGGTKIDNLVQIGHNVVIGEHCAIAGTAGVAGSAVIGNHVRIGASAGIAGHITIGDGASIGGRSGVTASVDPGQVVSGFPAVPHSLERRNMVARQQLPELLKRVRQLELKLQALEKASQDETTDHS